VLDEQLHNSNVPILSCRLHRRRPTATGVHICAVLEEKLDNTRVAIP
jgi:hypothetical protein